MSADNSDLDAELAKLTSRFGKEKLIKSLLQSQRSETLTEPAAVKRRKNKAPSKKNSSQSTAQESLGPFLSEDERFIQKIEAGPSSPTSPSTIEDSSECSDSILQHLTAIKSKDETAPVVKKMKTSRSRKSTDKDTSPIRGIVQKIEAGPSSAVSTFLIEDSCERSDSILQDQTATKSKDEAVSVFKKKKTSRSRKSTDKDKGLSTGMIQQIEAVPSCAVSTSTIEDSSECSDSYWLDQTAIKSKDLALPVLKKMKTSIPRKSTKKDKGPSKTKDCLKPHLSKDKLTVSNTEVSNLVTSNEIPNVTPATVQRRRCSSPLHSLSPGKKRKEDEEDESNAKIEKGNFNFSCSVKLVRMSVKDIFKSKPPSEKYKPMPKSVRENYDKLKLNKMKPPEPKESEVAAGDSDPKLKILVKASKEHKEPGMSAGASDTKTKTCMKAAISKESNEQEMATGASHTKVKIPKRVVIPKEHKEPEMSAGASGTKIKIPMKAAVPKEPKEPEMAAGGSHTKFKIPKKATIPEKPQEPEKAAGAVDIKSKIQGTTSLEHNRPGKKSKVPVRKQHEVQMSVKNQPEVQPEASERRQHDVLTVGRMENENEVPSKASAIKGHQIVAKESFPQALANEKTTEETSADKHNFLLPSVPLRKPPKVKPQSYMGSLLSDGFSHYHDFKVDKAKIDPLEQYQLEDQDLDYEEDPAENDDAISIFAESIFPIEESEEDLLQKVKHDDSDDDSSVASFGSSRNTSDSESDETQNFWTAKEQENSEVLVQHVDDNVSASHKEPVLGVPVENYHKSNQMSGFVDYLCNQDLNTKASNEVPLISDKPSHKKTICDDRRENMKGVSRSICANTVSNDQSGDQSFKKNIFGRDEETQQQTDLGIGSSFAGITSLNQSKDSGNADFPNACQNKPSFSKGVQNPQCQTENRPLQALPRRIQTEKSQTERASSKHQVPLNPRQPLLPTPVFHPVVPNMPMELINYPSADSSSVFSFPILSSTRCSADTMSNHEGKDKMMVDHHMLGKTDTDLRTIGATNFRISSQVPSIGPEVEEFLRPFCLKFLSSGMCSVDNCTQSHKLPDIRLLVNLRDRSLMRKIFDSMISKYDFWMENKLPGEVQELGNENNRNLLLAISTHLWKKLTSKEISKDYSYLWKNVADALSACGLSPNKVLKQILNSMEKESTTTIYYALDNMFEVLFDDYIKDQDLIGDSLKALNLANYQLPEKVLKEFLKAVLKFKSVDMPVCQYLLTMPEKWRPRKLVEHDIFHLIIKLASKLHSESPKTCSDLMKHFDISLQSLNISRSCPDSSSPKMRGGKSTHRFSLQHIDLNIESQGLGSDISSSKRVTPEESTVSSENSTKNCSTREEEVTSSTEEVKTEVQTSDLALTKTQPKEEAHQSKPAFTDKISIKVDSTKRVCSMLTQNPNSVDTDKVKKTAPRRVGKSDDLVRAVKSGMMGTAAKILLAGQPSDRLDIKIYEELKNFSAVKRCDMYSKLFEPIKRSWSLNRNHSSSKAAMIRIGLLLVNDLISERFWQKAEEVLSRIAPLMDVMSEVEIESISTSTLMLMKVQVNIHNNSERKKDLLVEAFREFMQCELFRKEGEWLIPNLEEDVGRRDEVANDLLEKCMECKELVDNAETLFKEMLKFRESYRTFDVASKFYDKILRALLKARKVPAAFRLFGWAHDSQQLTPNVSTCRALCFAVTTLDENDQRCFSPLIVLLMEQAPYKDALFRQTGLYTITLPSIWFCCEVRCIMRYVLNAHVSNLQEIPEIVINIQETSVPEDDLHGVKVVDASSSAMMMRVVEALQPFKLFSPTEQWKDNSITLDAELVKKYVANQRRNVRTNQETASKCLSSRGQHILGARPGSHMPRPEGRGAQRLMSERGEHHEGYGYQQVSRFQTWQQSAFGQMQSPQLTSPTMSGNPPEEARWQQTTSHPSSYLQQSRQEQEARRPQPTNPPPSYLHLPIQDQEARRPQPTNPPPSYLHLPIQDQEANWSQNTPPPQLYPPYQPTYPHPPSYNLRNSFPPHGPTASQESRTAGNFRGRWNRGRGAYRGHRRPTRPLFS